MSRGKDAPAKGRNRPAGPCAFCGVRVPRRRPTPDGRPGNLVPELCDNCDSGRSFQFDLRDTVARVTPFAENRWRQASIVDTRAGLRFGVRRR